jgi:hypothetical protein
MTNAARPLPETQVGPAERLLDLVLNSSAHLWHNRPGVDVSGVWKPAPRAAKGKRAPRAPGPKVAPGLFAPAAEVLYGKLLDIYQLNTELMAHFASYALVETDWRDLKVAACALMLVQGRAGQPFMGDDGAVAFYEDDLRAIGEAMILHYRKASPRMMTPKAILRVAELLESPGIATLNRAASFGDAASKRPPLGRWPSVARRWLAAREKNPAMLEGLVKAGYKETLKKIARKAGYKPESQAFFEVLGWRQKQASAGHRTLGLTDLKIERRARFDNLTEAQICERICAERLSFKDVVGRLPRGRGLTPAIMVTLLPSLPGRDLRLLTPTLEELGLMGEPEILRKWEAAVASATDQRSLNIARNVRSKDLREKLEVASDNAARAAVAEATAEADVHVMFLIDKSGSMQGAIHSSKEALSRILAGFPAEKLHIASFDTMGTVLRPKAPSRPAVQHMLSSILASGGTVHGSALRALRQAGVAVPAGARLAVIVVGDEDGEAGRDMARAFAENGYAPSALALLISVANNGKRGTSVRDCAREMGLPFSEVTIDQFDDPYQVPRVLRALLDSPILAPVSPVAGAPVVLGRWLERVMATPLLSPPPR